MTTLSASMIVKDEEAVLERCLRSLEGIDEIVILDTGSTDRTSEIACKYTDKYHAGEYQWELELKTATVHVSTKPKSLSVSPAKV